MKISVRILSSATAIALSAGLAAGCASTATDVPAGNEISTYSAPPTASPSSVPQPQLSAPEPVVTTTAPRPSSTKKTSAPSRPSVIVSESRGNALQQSRSPSSSPTASATSSPTETVPQPNPTQTVPTREAVTLTITDNQFSALSAPADASVTVVNNDPVKHSVTSAGAFNITVEANSAATFIAPSGPGNYPIACIYHPTMTGTLRVT